MKKVVEVAPGDLYDGVEVRLTSTGNVYEIMVSSLRPKGGVICKLNADEYVDVRDGTVHRFRHIESRADALDDVRQSLKRLRDIINTNVTDVSRCKWITLTYAENMTDPVRLKTDFESFRRKVVRKYGQFEYINAAEPQGRGAWHLHCIFIFPKQAPYMANADVRSLWGQGFVKVKRLDNVDNVGAYLSAYMCDLELAEATRAGYLLSANDSVKDVTFEDSSSGKREKKSFVKGSRLHLYPPNFNIYRCSNGIKMPVVERLSFREAKEKIGLNLKPTFSKTIHLDAADIGVDATFQYRYYNTKRK